MVINISCYNPNGEDRMLRTIVATPLNFRALITEAVEWFLEDTPDSIINRGQPMTVKIKINPE